MMNEEPEHEIESRASSPKVARVVKDSLERLKNGDGGPEMQEIARELLEGRISLRDLSRSSVYAHVFTQQIQQYREREENLTAEQREQIEQQVKETYGPTAFEGGFWSAAGIQRRDQNDG